MGVAEEVERLTKPVLEAAGLELVLVDYRREPSGWVLRFYLDKPGGISLDECAEWSHRLGQALDATDLLTNAYSLEVSSPGLDRPLRKPEDFQRFLGIEAVIKLYAPHNGQKNFHGRLVRLEDGELTVEDRTSGPVNIPFTAIASARLDPKLDL